MSKPHERPGFISLQPWIAVDALIGSNYYPTSLKLTNVKKNLALESKPKCSVNLGVNIILSYVGAQLDPDTQWIKQILFKMYFVVLAS